MPQTGAMDEEEKQSCDRFNTPLSVQHTQHTKPLSADGVPHKVQEICNVAQRLAEFPPDCHIGPACEASGRNGTF